MLRRGDHHIFARNICRKVAAGRSLADEGPHRGCLGRSLGGEALGFAGIGLEFFEGHLELVDEPARAFRFRSIFVAAHQRVHQFEMRIAGQKVGVDRLDAGRFCLCLECLGLSFPGFSLGALDQLTRQGELGVHLQNIRKTVARRHACQ